MQQTTKMGQFNEYLKKRIRTFFCPIGLFSTTKKITNSAVYYFLFLCTIVNKMLTYHRQHFGSNIIIRRVLEGDHYADLINLTISDNKIW
jgi:hypothetical protein